MFENPIKETLVDGYQERRRKTERLLAQNLRDAGRNLVSFFSIVFVVGTLRLRFVIRFNECLRLVQGNLPLDVFLGDSSAAQPTAFNAGVM